MSSSVDQVHAEVGCFTSLMDLIVKEGGDEEKAFEAMTGMPAPPRALPLDMDRAIALWRERIAPC